MLLTLGCITLVLGGSLFLGVPLAWLANGRRPLEEEDWLLAPFFGLCGAMLPLHNLVYADCPIARAGPWIWRLAGALWLWFLFSRRQALANDSGTAPIGAQFRASARALPRRVFLAAVAVYLVHGLGLLVIGAQDYLARAHMDQENYTVIAQFLTEQPYSTDPDSVGQKPYLVEGIVLKNDRLGAMVLQGFFAGSMGADARTLFEPLILLGPALLVLAVYALGRRLGQDRSRALVTAVAASLLPGLCSLQLDSFLSHTLSVPFLLIALLTLHDLATKATGPQLLRAAVLVAGTISLYGELTAILLGLTVVCLACGLILGTLSWSRGLFYLLSVPVLGVVALNPLYVGRLIDIAVTRAFYQSAGGLVSNDHGFGFVWVADIWAAKPGWTGRIVLAFAAQSTLLGVYGLGCLAARCRILFDPAGAADLDQRRSLVLVGGVLALAVVPLLVLLRDRQHPYQFQKLFLSVSPLLVLGVAHVGTKGPRLPAQPWLRWAPLASVLATGVIGTTAMALQTVSLEHPSPWSRQVAVLDRDHRDVCHALRSLHGQKLVLACGPGVFQNSWLAYAARDNDVWLVNPVINNGFVLLPRGVNPPGPDLRPGAVGLQLGSPDCRLRWAWDPDLHPVVVGQQLVDLRTLPRETFLLKCDRDGPQVVVEGDSHQVWANAAYELRRLGPGPYTLRPTRAALRPNGTDGHCGKQ